MDALENLFSRRSIRKYKNVTLSEKDIKTLLKAAMQAPTARNKQTWQFVVVNERDKLNALMQAHPYAKMLKDAPLAIIVCGDKNLDDSLDYLSVNGAAATQNILLAAHALGLGAVWLGVYGREDRMKDISKIFSLPEHIVPISAIAVGVPNEEKPAEDRFDDNKVHYNNW